MSEPARNVVTPSKGRVVGYFYSVKNKRQISWESQLERDCMRVLDILPEVVQYKSQPFRMEYDFQGRSTFYYPDIEVLTDTGRKIIEVKPTRKLSKNALPERFNLIRRILAKHEYSFEIWTEDRIRKEPMWSNVQQLLPYRLLGGIIHSDLSLARAFSGRKCISIAELANTISTSNTIEAVLPYIAEGKLCVDLNEPITADSLVWFYDGRIEL